MIRYAFLVAILLVIFVFTGCSRLEMSDVNSDKEDSKESKQLVFGRGADSVQLDPSKVTDGESIYVTSQIYDTLVRYEHENTEISPSLANSWDVSEDGKVWTFKLKKGIKFHDKTKFTAEDVVYNFERWMTSEDFIYYGYMFGASEADRGGIIEKVEAVSDYKVRFVLEKPYAPFLNTLAMPPFAIGSPEAIEKYKEGFFENPVGTGPFIFKKWIKDEEIRLAKNEDYFGEVSKVDEVIFRVIPDNEERFKELQAGGIDIMNGLNPEDIQSIELDDHLQVIRRPSMNVGYMAMNTSKEGPMSEVKVRQAINLAVDKERLMTIFKGIGKAAKNPMPPSLWGFNDDIVDYGYNVEEAKRLLAEAGYQDGFEITLYTMSNPRPYLPQPKLVALMIQQMLAEVGITVEIVENYWATHVKVTQYGQHDMAFLGWNGDNGDPDNFLYVLLDKDNAKIGSAGNIAFYKNDELHDLLMQARVEKEQQKRVDLYKRAQVIIHNDAPWVPITHTTPALAANKNIKNYVPHPTGSEAFNYIKKVK